MLIPRTMAMRSWCFVSFGAGACGFSAAGPKTRLPFRTSFGVKPL